MCFLSGTTQRARDDHATHMNTTRHNLILSGPPLGRDGHVERQRLRMWLRGALVALAAWSALHCAAFGGHQSDVVQAVVTGPGEVRGASGARWRVPLGARAQVRGAVVHFQIPDEPVEVFVVELRGRRLSTAVSRAWALAAPDFRRAAAEVLEPPDPWWDAVREERDVTSPDGVSSRAVARRLGRQIWVTLVRGPRGALERRSAQIAAFTDSMRLPGEDALDLSDVAPSSVRGREASLRDFILAAMEATATPGLQIAVVEDGQVAWLAAFGDAAPPSAQARATAPRPMTPDTRLLIGSLTKPLTTFLMARLVDEGLWRWDTPVHTLQPPMKLADPDLTKALELQHLVCSCAGLPRADLPIVLGAFQGADDADLLADLALRAPTTDVGQTFQYQNQLVAAAGVLAARLDGASTYAQAMTARVFEPLGMTRTTFDLREVTADADYAQPHAQSLQGEPVAIDPRAGRFTDVLAPAGGAWSTARDLASFVLTELQQGRAPDGRLALSPEQIALRRTPVVATGDGAYYGLGWHVDVEAGLPRVWHDGGTTGTASLMRLYPEQRRGLVILTNGLGGHLLQEPLAALIFAMWFESDRRAHFRDAARDAQRQLDHAVSTRRARLERRAARLKAPAEADLTPWLGQHEHPTLGAWLIRTPQAEDASWAGDAALILEGPSWRTGLVLDGRPERSSPLIMTTPPLAGLTLHPVFDDAHTFELRRAQERYPFQRRSPAEGAR